MYDVAAHDEEPSEDKTVNTKHKWNFCGLQMHGDARFIYIYTVGVVYKDINMLQEGELDQTEDDDTNIN